jgi:hypothetical protein
MQCEFTRCGNPHFQLFYQLLARFMVCIGFSLMDLFVIDIFFLWLGILSCIFGIIGMTMRWNEQNEVNAFLERHKHTTHITLHAMIAFAAVYAVVLIIIMRYNEVQNRNAVVNMADGLTFQATFIVAFYLLFYVSKTRPQLQRTRSNNEIDSQLIE